MSLVITGLYGPCPMEATGTINGVPFYFRARWGRWQFGVGEDPVGIAMSHVEGWRRDGLWDDGLYLDDAEMVSVAIIKRCTADYAQATRKAHGIGAAFIDRRAVEDPATGEFLGPGEPVLLLRGRHRCGQPVILGEHSCGKCRAPLGRDNGPAPWHKPGW